MDLLDRIDKLVISDETGATVTDNVEDNTDKASPDVVSKQKKCPEGEKW